jgi:hypothetical protein
MMWLTKDVVLWSHPLGTRAIPLVEASSETDGLGDESLGLEAQPVQFIGAYPAGTPIDDVVDIGEQGHVRCTIDGNRVATVKWALSHHERAASHASTQS